MAAIPPRMHATIPAIYRLYEERAKTEKARGYLGGSAIGDECARRLWLSFRFATSGGFDGRMLRLFDTGHREEARLLDELRAIGLTVWDRQPDGSQFGVEACGGHFRGHLDAVVEGMPEAPKTPHLVDVKTIRAKKFDELMGSNIKTMYPVYYAQGTVYMGLTGLTRAAFFFVCKDDDRIHVERFEFDPIHFAKLMARAERIVFSQEPPPRLSNDPEFFGCQFCGMRAICHETAAPDVNCRTCAHVTPTQDGGWKCERPGHELAALSVAAQRIGCNGHRYIPILIEQFAEFKDGGNGNPEYSNKLTGRPFVNGDGGYTSHEISACQDKRALGDAGVDALREQFDGRVVA